MSVKFHATGAREHMGFVAEIVTLPISLVGVDRDLRHNMSFSVFDNNQRGAVSYASAGEINPIVTMQRNQVQYGTLPLSSRHLKAKILVNMGCIWVRRVSN